MKLEDAIALLRANGYRVTKPKPKRSKDRVGPTFVAKVATGQITRMSTFTSLADLDVGRGCRLAEAAWQSRKRRRLVSPKVRDALARMEFSLMNRNRLAAFIERRRNPTPPVLVSAHFEQDGVTLATYEPEQLLEAA